MSFLYLASPYSSPDLDLRGSRFRQVRRAASVFTLEKIPVFSPVVHGHTLDLELSSIEFPDQHEFWMAQAKPILRVAGALGVLKLFGWEDSFGVRVEIDLARNLHIPIFLFEHAPFTRSLNEARRYIRSVYPTQSPEAGVRSPALGGLDGIDSSPRADASGSSAA